MYIPLKRIEIKFLLFTLLLISQIGNCYTQQLSIEQAITYLEDILNKDLKLQKNYYGGEKSISIKTFDTKINIQYIWVNNEDVLYQEYVENSINYNEVVFDIKEVDSLFLKKYKSKKTVSVACKSGSKSCFMMEHEAIKNYFSKEFSDRPLAYNHYNYIHLFYLTNTKNQEIVFDILNYIFTEILASEKSKAIKRLLLLEQNSDYELINLEQRDHTFYLNTSIGGNIVDCILDTSLCDMSISKQFLDLLVSNNIINEKNVLPSGFYLIEDGSITKRERFLIPYVKINHLVVKNIQCSVNPFSNKIILGKSFLNTFKGWKIDSQSNNLIIEK